MSEAPFGRIEPEDVTLAGGEVVHLPIRYHDLGYISASFTISAPRARELLAGTTLHPVELLPGRAVLVLAALEYRHLTERDGRERAPYSEFLVGIPVLHGVQRAPPLLPLLLPGRFEGFGIHVHHLPVTTEESRDAGIRIWGLPKIVGTITCEESERSRRCFLHADGREVLALEVDRVRTRSRRARTRLYGVEDGQLRRTQFQEAGEGGTARFRGGATLWLGDHPISDDIRRLEPGRRAIERTWAPRMKGLLHRPEEHRDGRWAARQAVAGMAMPLGGAAGA